MRAWIRKPLHQLQCTPPLRRVSCEPNWLVKHGVAALSQQPQGQRRSFYSSNQSTVGMTNCSNFHYPHPHYEAMPAQESIGSIRRDWRAYVEKLENFPALQRFALETASLFSKPSDLDFGLPRDFHDKYELNERIGAGAFGKVHRVVPKETRSMKLDLAVKIIPKKRVINVKDYDGLKQEGRMMLLLGGTLNVVHFFGAYEDDKNVYFVIEHCVGGDAFARLEKKYALDEAKKQQEQLDIESAVAAAAASASAVGAEAVAPSPVISLIEEDLVATYMADVLHVVWQCHLLHILHGDLKLENFLFADNSEDSPLKLTDFGGAEFLQEGDTLTGVRGTPLYTAPEVIHGEYSFPADMWSCGVILYRLLTGRFPFEGNLLDERIRFEDIDFESAPWPSISPEARDLTMRLLDRDQSKRLTAEQALQHPWLASALGENTQNNVHNLMDNPELLAHQVPSSLDGSLVQRMQWYRTLNGFQQIVLREVVRALPLKLKQELLVLFTDISLDNSKQVDLQAFAMSLARLGYRLTLGEVKSFLARLDLSGDGKLGFDEFCAALLDWHTIQQLPEWKTAVETAFASFDHDSDGRLMIDDIVEAMPKGMEEHTFLGDARRCFLQADSDKNGWLDLTNFESMVLMPPEAWRYYASRWQPEQALAAMEQAEALLIEEVIDATDEREEAAA